MKRLFWQKVLQYYMVLTILVQLLLVGMFNEAWNSVDVIFNKFMMLMFLDCVCSVCFVYTFLAVMYNIVSLLMCTLD